MIVAVAIPKIVAAWLKYLRKNLVKKSVKGSDNLTITFNSVGWMRLGGMPSGHDRYGLNMRERLIASGRKETKGKRLARTKDR